MGIKSGTWVETPNDIVVAVEDESNNSVHVYNMETHQDRDVASDAVTPLN